MELQAFIVWLVSGGGAAWVAFKLMEIVPFLVNLVPRDKRYASLALAGVVAMLAQAAAVACKFTPTPADWLGWVTLLFSAASLAVIGSQAKHGQANLATVTATEPDAGP